MRSAVAFLLALLALLLPAACGREEPGSGASAAAVVERAIEERGVAAARSEFERLRSEEGEGDRFDEEELVDLGDRLLRAGRIAEAVAVFEMAVEAFPESWNARDSLGEALVYAGDGAGAVRSYEKSLELNPDNENAAWKLRMVDGQVESLRRETREPVRPGAGEATGLRGPYLGQEPPGLRPEVFAPGLVSTRGNLEYACTISPAGDEIYFNRGTQIMVSRLGEAGWTVPEPAPFTLEYGGYEAHITHDGRRLWFGRGPEIWVMERSGDGWGKAERFGPGMFATTTRDGTVYFTDISGEEDPGVIRRSRLAGVRYGAPELVGGGVNSPFIDAHPCVAPDESFLIFDSFRPGGLGLSDFWVSFRDDGDWSEPLHLGEELNTAGENVCATLSPDGAYLFFTANNDIYWVSAGILDALRPRRGAGD